MNTPARRFVAYYRVSTERQGKSGLGLEAQRAAVLSFVAGQGALLSECTEIETGKRGDRPELAKALAHAKRTGATLVIAKLDRLARNVAFVSSLMEAEVDFLACDNPTANRLTVHILAAVAEDEARRISERTKAALMAYRSRGGLLGSQHPKCRSLSQDASRKGQVSGAARNRERALAAYSDLLPLMKDLQNSGRSLRAISRNLNELGHTTRTGKPWEATQVRRVLLRFR